MLDVENIYDIEDTGKNYVMQLENITNDHIWIKSYLYSKIVFSVSWKSLCKTERNQCISLMKMLIQITQRFLLKCKLSAFRCYLLSSWTGAPMFSNPFITVSLIFSFPSLNHWLSCRMPDSHLSLYFNTRKLSLVMFLSFWIASTAGGSEEG